MGYRDELEAARLRIVSLEEELGRLRGGVVQWTPEEVVELRQALHDAQLEVARLRREREGLEAARSAKDESPAREASGEGALTAARMWGRTWELRARHLASQLASVKSLPAPAALSDSDMAAFRALFSPDALRAAGSERGRELFLRIASSIYDGSPFRREAVEPALTLLRAAGHVLVDEGDRLRGAALEMIAQPDHFELRVGFDVFSFDAGTG